MTRIDSKRTLVELRQHNMDQQVMFSNGVAINARVNLGRGSISFMITHRENGENAFTYADTLEEAIKTAVELGA